MTKLYCGVCGNWFEPDDDHVRVQGEHVRMDDRNDVDEYYFHTECWQRVSGGWMDPA
jgi:hypothetical protein